ncbi:hypothetical protein N1851_017006 [Merluccius polli]|uniref:Integrase catalytic domain-containing protein n=1 Tax=Merluccius polli TaxID=89951 RepID=A0AA47MQZ4_MERPO|nr:hypothetical protein N1851_017006 [Merluccius polli]
MLCFGCLSHGHHSRDCSRRMFCDICSKRHPTCLHKDRPPQQNKERFKVENSSEERELHSISQDVIKTAQDSNSIQTSTIVPVYVSGNSGKEVLVYALLDSQSDSSFILEEVADALELDSEPVKLKLSTMSSRGTIVSCRRLKGLRIRGPSSSKEITVPTAYTREFIPANRSHIPTSETARAWPHLEHLTQHISPYRECEIGLLIGYNCPQALMPREVVCGEGNQPFAQRTDLSWSIVSYVNPFEHDCDAIGVSHRIIVKQVIPQPNPPVHLKGEVHFVLKTQIKEIVTPDDVMKLLESDFSEQVGEDAAFSQEDLLFLKKLKGGIKHKPDGHLEMPLPFKQERPRLPNNMSCAAQRLTCLGRRLKKDQKYYSDYTNFMEDLITRGDAEKVPEEQVNNCPAWYIPHHGVYHPRKPEKIRVVFDCSVRFRDAYLNDHLLTGPELTSTLIGVRCRFRKGPIAITCDVERMFHQFHVRPEDGDYLRFLWWEKGNLESPPSIFRMKVHLFGAASSPGCANFGLQHLAFKSQGQFDQNTIKFIKRNFYVDDGLISVPSNVEAIQLIKEAKELCSTGNLRLHKFTSNSMEVLKSIPEEDRAQSIKDLDMDFGELHMERVLGVQWCVSSDDFEFRVMVKERPMTRRGVLSTVASIYDPLGFVAPFILRGKQILQQLCRDKVGWDEPLPEELGTQWALWLKDLPNLSSVKIKRCYVPVDFKDIQHYELHHFADASVTEDKTVGEVDGNDPEFRRVQAFSTKVKEERTLLDRLTKFSDWKRAIIAIACLKRHAKRLKGVKDKLSSTTTIAERHESELFIIKLAQKEAFSHEMKSIQQCKEVRPKDKTNKLYKLSPFIDQYGVLRVGGWLANSVLHPHIKHPAIMPKASHVSSLLIKHFHERVRHQGRGMTINELRSNGIWITGCSSAVASYIHKCTTCRKYRRLTQDPKMADLPMDRMEETPPFTYCGIDCFGPFYVKEARKELKRYGLLLTCMCSRAIHIEMLDDLTTDAFINALRAFIAIRGNVRQLRCDQGTNFVGAKREFLNAMKDLDQEQIRKYGCEFIMNTPSSSHMGGVWERQIRTIRSVLTAILDQSGKRLDSASLRTFLYEVMAIVNSRPLTIEHLNDPTSLEPLTPNHILTMKSSIMLPPPGQFVGQDLYLRKRWRQVQFLANKFWTRWKKEYLLNLQQRQVWQGDKRNAKVNDIVILQEEGSPRNQWKLAKVAEVYPSNDGRVRKVKLLLGDSTLDHKGRRMSKPLHLDRPVQKIVVLLEA